MAESMILQVVLFKMYSNAQNATAESVSNLRVHFGAKNKETTSVFFSKPLIQYRKYPLY